MSSATLQAIEEAVAAHLLDIDEDGEHSSDIILGWVISLKTQDLNDEERKTWYKRISPDTQSFDISVGLIEVARMGQQAYWNEE